MVISVCQSYKYWKKRFLCVTMKKVMRKETLTTTATYEDYLSLPHETYF